MLTINNAAGCMGVFVTFVTEGIFLYSGHKHDKSTLKLHGVNVLSLVNLDIKYKCVLHFIRMQQISSERDRLYRNMLIIVIGRRPPIKGPSAPWSHSLSMPRLVTDIHIKYTAWVNPGFLEGGLKSIKRGFVFNTFTLFSQIKSPPPPPPRNAPLIQCKKTYM